MFANGFWAPSKKSYARGFLWCDIGAYLQQARVCDEEQTTHITITTSSPWKSSSHEQYR